MRYILRNLEGELKDETNVLEVENLVRNYRKSTKESEEDVIKRNQLSSCGRIC